MKKFCLIIFILFTLNLPSFAGFEVGDTRVLNQTLKVRNSIPYSGSKSRVVATLPMNTAVEIIDFVSEDIGKWYKIRWYSEVDKIHKEAWTEEPLLITMAATVSDVNKSEFKQAFMTISNAILSIDKFDFETTRYYIKYGKYDDAIRMHNKKLYELFIVQDLDPSDLLKMKIGQILSLRGIAYGGKNLNLAIDDLDEALLYWNHYSVYKAKGEVLYIQGYYSKAKDLFLCAKMLAIKDGNQKDIIEINEWISKVNYQLARLK